MASEGPRDPGTMADDNTIGTLAWANPDNAKLSDNNYTNIAFTAPAATSHYLKATNFGFSIPTGATIDGVLVEIENVHSGGSGTVQWDEIKIVKGGSIGAENKATGNVNSVKAYTSFGAVDSLWSETWEDSDINSATFGVVISTSSLEDAQKDPFIDHIRITVYYTEAAGGTNMQVNIGDVWKPIEAAQINIGDTWKAVAGMQINIGDAWKTIF